MPSGVTTVNNMNPFLATYAIANLGCHGMGICEDNGRLGRDIKNLLPPSSE